MTSVSNFDILINKFKENSLTHPNISRFWITYLELKKKSFEMLLEQGLSVIEQIQPRDNIAEDSNANANANNHSITDIEMKELINMMIIKMIL
jgi:hypothetical protein